MKKQTPNGKLTVGSGPRAVLYVMEVFGYVTV